MSEQDGRPPRSRPVYGLPAEQAPAPPAPGGPGPFGQPGPAAEEPAWRPLEQPSGAAPVQHGAPSQPLPGPTGAPGRRSRRPGVICLVLGLVSLVVLSPAALVLGFVFGMGGLVGDAAEGPTPFPGESVSLETPANSMVIVYVAQADAATASCTAESDGSAALTPVPQSGTVTFGDGSTYQQVLGVAAHGDTTMTITCEGTTSPPAYLGPYGMAAFMGPLAAGIIGGLLLGLIGLILTIIGIVILVRRRRS
ncbi:hypothetical protein [Brachybacterium hainanense]|uniref:Serine/threonine protein kinase n=1 Tax=Brachybacterium hainanense TaxID=1541174 RepID=A0ABV6RDP5_9MICO